MVQNKAEVRRGDRERDSTCSASGKEMSVATATARRFLKPFTMEYT